MTHNGTVLLTRREESEVEEIRGFMGYSQEYLKAALRLPQGLEKALGHHRIIELNIGGLKVMGRFHADASADVSADTTSMDALASAISSLSVQASSVTSGSPSFSFKPPSIKPSSMTGIHLSPLGPSLLHHRSKNSRISPPSQLGRNLSPTTPLSDPLSLPRAAH